MDELSMSIAAVQSRIDALDVRREYLRLVVGIDDKAYVDNLAQMLALAAIRLRLEMQAFLNAGQESRAQATALEVQRTCSLVNELVANNAS